MHQDILQSEEFPTSSESDQVTDVEVDPGFSVRDDSTANWLIRQIVERRAYSKHCAEWCKREQNRARHEEEFFLYRYGQQLIEFIRAKMEANGGRRKSVNLPAGTAGFRTEATKLVIDDEQRVIAWAKANLPQAVGIVERLSKSALNEHLEEAGELPSAGAHVEPAREKFYIK